MEWELSVTEQSFDRAGITKDAEEAICEYIWNGFEAGATKVCVELTGKPLEEARTIRIKDNGSGIDFSRLNESFRAFLASPKLSESIRIKSQKNKGKGRFSYTAFASSASWITIFQNAEGKLLSYTINMYAAAKRAFRTSSLTDAEGMHTGTTVEIPVAEANIEERLSYEKIRAKLLEEFSWYLYLNKEREITLNYQGIDLDFLSHVDLDFSRDKNITISNHGFQISVIVWKDRVDNGSKVYYMTTDGILMNVENTSFNKNTVDFYHAVFVCSKYFKEVVWIGNEDPDDSVISLMPDDQQTILKDVRREVRTMVDAVLNDFLRKKADDHVESIFKQEIAPRFSTDDYGQIRKRDFERVTRALYCAEPKIFYQLKPIQEKSLLGFMNLLLSSDERDNILEILAEVVNLSTDQRAQLANVLKRTSLEHILDLLEMLRQRNDTVANLKTIVFDLTQYANERDHIQEIIEDNYWLFGEGYRLITADREMQTSLRQFEEITGVSDQDTIMMGKKEKTDRMDIFLYASQNSFDGKKECLVIELKSPNVPLTTTVFSFKLG